MQKLNNLFSCAFVAIACASASAQSAGMKSIKAYYAQDDALALKLDFAGLKKLKMAYSTPDFVAILKVDKTGKSLTKTRADEFAQMDSIAKMISSISKSTSHIDHVTVGKTTIVVVVSSSGSLQTKKMPQDGKVHALNNTSTSEDTWVKVGGSWKMKSSKSISNKMVVDGHPIPGG